MHAYYFDNLLTDQRLPHITDPARPVSPETLAKLGVLSASRKRRTARSIGQQKNAGIRTAMSSTSREGMGAVYEEKIR
ncbi:1,2-dihydroxy-3-keto-5-methylthiopentene dioxygenase [Mycena sanguinolenta]|uniref:1,2-dihydroxy-3-keto-5-methylthiopentene dioxygenase n=1 Tax=Mycena sanguinolenta TaxID=230812 RepID=A0A8H7CZ16_9AGAR|nr:1,2-dihydroxy-3-keto-5-methylthiopentene dioxygenase [Mycena sanguinolenta]